MLDLLIVLFSFFSMQVTSIDQKEMPIIDDTSKWHPKMFYLVYPDLSLRFILPYEPDQSGVYNLFFISKESGETILLDTIKDNRRYLTPFSSGESRESRLLAMMNDHLPYLTPFSSGKYYDAVLLYNNGKYVKYDDFVFENGAEVDMRNQTIQPSDSVSEHWKMMRAFDDAISDRASDRNDMAVSSDFIIKGYVFSGFQRSPWEYETTVQIKSSETNVKTKSCTNDGYFEFDVENGIEQTLRVSAGLHLHNEINITASCGVFLVMKGFGKARKDPQ